MNKTDEIIEEMKKMNKLGVTAEAQLKKLEKKYSLMEIFEANLNF